MYEKREIELTCHIHDLLLDDFGLTKEGFAYVIPFTFPNEKPKKTLTKKMPNLTIRDYIKYIKK